MYVGPPHLYMWASPLYVRFHHLLVKSKGIGTPDDPNLRLGANIAPYACGFYVSFPHLNVSFPHLNVSPPHLKHVDSSPHLHMCLPLP